MLNDMDFLITLLVSTAAGAITGWAAFSYLRTYFLKKTQEEADEIIQEAKDQSELDELERKEQIQEIELELWGKVEADLLKVEERVEELQERADENKKKADAAFNTARATLAETDKELKTKEQKLDTEVKAYNTKKEALKNLRLEYAQNLSNKLGTSITEAKSQIIQSLIHDSEERARNYIESSSEEIKEHAETRAKRMIDRALDRFARAYCPERGIGAVYFPEDPAPRKNLCDPDGKNIQAVQESCGCDIIIQEDSDLVGVAGFDPVRREHTRRTLEKLLKEKRQITPEIVKRIADNQKAELLKNITSDGEAIFKELGLHQVHPEIKQMMGALRYRYSFTQNQHFHCAEVGWLAGLLASELGTDIKLSRRSGVLHDLGKSMDHAMDGGHAVIGANFIAARNESPEVVHAVRSHHFDEQPNSDNAFLVIAADAISGARPGARRSTMESYSQKINELIDIARRFDGVNDAIVLNGGREIRVYVNSKKVDDIQALDISKKVAQSIEAELSYPGQIKVMVVRETLASETTHASK